MKQTVIVIFLFQFFLSQGSKLQASDRYQIGLECINQVGIDREIVENAIAGEMPEHDVNYKNFLACSYKKQGFQDDNGKMLIPKVQEFLQDFYNSSDLNGLKICERNGSNHGENAFQSMKCIMNHLQNLTAIDEE